MGGWVAPEPVWTQGLEEKSSAPVGDLTPIVQPVVRHYTDCATAAHKKIVENDTIYSLLMMEAASTSETSVNFHQII
jgi:hypothetical protein